MPEPPSKGTDLLADLRRSLAEADAEIERRTRDRASVSDAEQCCRHHDTACGANFACCCDCPEVNNRG